MDGGGEARRRTGAGKLALLFMVKRGPNNPGIWRRWLSRAPTERYSILVHAKLGVVDPLFRDRCIPTVPTEWGTVSLVEAHLALLRAGLKDPDNRYAEHTPVDAKRAGCFPRRQFASCAASSL
jgi:hypothetical protein